MPQGFGLMPNGTNTGKALNFWRKSMNGNVSPPAYWVIKWQRSTKSCGSTVVLAWTLLLASLSGTPCWNKLASWAANSNSLAALEMALAEFKAPWSMDGNIGHCFSTKWPKISHCQPICVRSHAVSSLGTSMAGPLSGVQPCWMALKNAVVWEAERLRQPQFDKSNKQQLQMQGLVPYSFGENYKNCLGVCLETFLATQWCHGTCCLLDDGLVGVDLLLPLGQLHGHALPKQLPFHSNGQHLLAFGPHVQP